jgi:cytochrome b subunit of formate dehydrogenase
MTVPTNSPARPVAEHRQPDPQDKMKKRARALKMRTALELAEQVKVMPDGSRMFVRFTRGEIIEHWVLLVSFSTLGFTGLMQRYAAIYAIGVIINVVFGGIDTLRVIHHLAAIVFGAQSIYHGFKILYFWFVRREVGAMFPLVKDITDMLEMIKYNAGFSKARPKFDRYTVEEKLEYWALIWGTLVMGLTGLMQWFPTITTQYLPGAAIPVARVAHSLEAVLAVAAIIMWHMYHSVIKEHNVSIFSGLMDEHEMQENHVLEYERILAAYDYVQKVKSGHEARHAQHASAEQHPTGSSAD